MENVYKLAYKVDDVSAAVEKRAMLKAQLLATAWNS